MARLKVVLANGVFDILHVGHVEHLYEARGMGDVLVVSLTFDDDVNKGPGRPIYSWNERATVLRHLRCVDSVVGTPNAVAAILAVSPDIFVKGIDYAGGDKFTEDIEKACKAVGCELRFTQSPKQSVTDLVRKICSLSS